MDATTPATNLEELHARVEQLVAAHQAEIAAKQAETKARLSAEAEAEQYRTLYNEALERCRMLELGLHPKGEKLPGDEAQLTLAVLGTLLGGRQTESKPNKTIKEHERSKPTGRRPLPEDLPRVDIEVLPDEVQREGLDAFEKIGEEVAEVVERRRAATVVVRIHRPKYVRKDRERYAETTVEIAAPPDLPIPRGLAGPGLLADTIIKRLCDHLPMHRQEKIFARDGLPIARSTICGWHRELANLCQPLIDAMWREAMEQAPYLCADATGVLVQAKDKCRRSHFWVVIAPGLHVMFRFSAKHNNKAADALVVGYKGYFVADAHAVYDHLYRDGTIIEVGCWAHARRYFFKALSSEPERAREALAMIGELFAIERKLKKQTPAKRKEIRLEKSRTILDAFFAWCATHVETVLDETPLSKAIHYAINQKDALQRFLEDGRLPIHNNHSERELRREAIGRKNWLFVGNDKAAKVNTTFVTLIASCQMHGVEPYAYLRDLLCLLPQWPRSRVLELAPAHWRETLQEQDTQQRLASNVFRQVALGDIEPHGS